VALSGELGSNSAKIMSNFSQQGRQNSLDNVFAGLRVGAEEASFVTAYFDSHDFSLHTRRAIRNDLRKFVHWFASANGEAFTVKRTTMRDIVDFRNCLHRVRRQAVASVNRALVVLRRFFDWLVSEGHLQLNPAKQVKELRRQQLAPKGLDAPTVRRLLREVELREDIRAAAIFTLMLYTGCRVSDLVNVELIDLIISDRFGSVTFRHGKGNKQRSVPLPLAARRALQAYLENRPAVSSKVFVGERGPLTDSAVRSLCQKYSTLIGARLHPHVFRHTMAKQFLVDNGNDLVSLAQILGHENLNTTSRYSQRSEQQLGAAAERLNY
jgi:site-specific recombinase XerD